MRSAPLAAWPQGADQQSNTTLERSQYESKVAEHLKEARLSLEPLLPNRQQTKCEPIGFALHDNTFFGHRFANERHSAEFRPPLAVTHE